MYDQILYSIIYVYICRLLLDESVSVNFETIVFLKIFTDAIGKRPLAVTNKMNNNRGTTTSSKVLKVLIVT